MASIFLGVPYHSTDVLPQEDQESGKYHGGADSFSGGDVARISPLRLGGPVFTYYF